MIIIGEKINGAIPSVAKAIEERDRAFIESLAIRQSGAGADYIDICAGTAASEELEVLSWLIDIVKSSVTTPICLDSPSAEVLAELIPTVPNIGLVNSVSGEKNKCDTLYPLIAERGLNVIALTCNDSGIPSSAVEKYAIAAGLIDKAKGYGIAEEQIYIDPLVFSLATVNDSLLSFADAVKQIKTDYPGVHITSGLSNISYGMPCRKLVNRNFLTLALFAGMDSAILDPCDADICSTILATQALLGQDKYCRKYNTAYRAGKIRQ